MVKLKMKKIKKWRWGIIMKMLRWGIVEGVVSSRVGYCQGWGIVKGGVKSRWGIVKGGVS